MKAFLTRFKNDDSGATAIEYGMIAGLVSIVVVTAAILMGAPLAGLFTSVATTITTPPTGG